MVKKRFLSLLLGVFLALLPVISAEISLTGPDQTTVNFGDQIKVQGSIKETADHIGFLKFELSCGETEVLATRALTLRANTAKAFAEAFTIPQTLTGTCNIHAAFESNDILITETTSSSFTVTSALNAPITLDKESVQLGDSVSLSGIITKMDGKTIEGLATILFKQGKYNVVQDTVKISKGKFAYTHQTEDNPAGNYEIQIEITDINNNKQTIVLNNLVVLGNIGLTITLNKKEFLPGDKIKIDGTARTGDSRISKGKAYISLDDGREEVTILLGILKHTITIPADIKTGEHTITVDVEDTHGNTETQSYSITIIAVPTRLELALNQESFMPEQQVIITPTLYDQGNDIIATDIELNVYDAEKDVVFTDTIKSAEQTIFTLPRSATPGFWKVKAESLDVRAFMSFGIGEFKVLEISQEGSIIAFANTGNVPIKEIQAITVTSTNDPTQSKTKQRKIKLNVGKTETYDLAYMIGQGVYTVQVGDKTFNNVEILKRKWNVLPYVTGIIGILIVYFLIKLWANRKPRHHAHQEKHHLAKPQRKPQQQPIQRQRSQEWYEEKLKKDLAERMEAQRSKVKFNFRKQKDDYVVKLQKKKSSDAAPWVRKPARQERSEVFTNSQDFSDPWKTAEEQPKKEEEKKKGGLFGMFD